MCSFLRAISAGAIRGIFFKLLLSHQVVQKFSKEKNGVITDFQGVLLMLALDLSEKLAKNTKRSIKPRVQHFAYIDAMGICDNIQKLL